MIHPIKIVGAILLVLGLLFRAVSLAYFNARARIPYADDRARRRVERQKRNALAIDAAFVVIGAYLILRG